MSIFNPNDHRSPCEEYLSRFLKDRVRFVRAEPLAKSTRDAPWRLDVEVDGVEKSYVLRLDSRGIEHEYEVLRAMEAVPIPTPRAYGWDPKGEALGVPCFFSEFIAGESLLKHMVVGEPWAETLYIDTVCALQAVTWEQVATVTHRFGSGETAVDVLETAFRYLNSTPNELTDEAFTKLKDTMPVLPEVRFSNGDLWPDNLIVRERELAGVIDFANAGFSDPIYEFLLPFFVSPELSGRGIEERYCNRMGFDPDTLPWYRALENLDTLHWVLKSGESFVQHTPETLSAELRQWLEG